ncbi:coproporphyrinogen III oxidase [Actinoplanes sp. SE50]|uniref:radical SAM family heme chaperone HemW n=1 Tax=unclassified Actinoplanes TaxID=2626549 RepID=UPI00023EBB0E|nr:MULTISPECIES: radical SAM family heme chaperone HemW [unclassified Actinoplanes]AEV82300.1 oxygen-independent coproporphyrinogen III oxidase [Actinoplanes sp. SE50/110]ATO80697.1 coproporphyrinogen III oxidase [Actinoplanes sp. SE50]SLL98104.1 coproporphyrinogen III oxidase [Actinoplanes sp. SE50/110]
MAGALPDGEPVPDDGSLPDDATRDVGGRGFAVYVHVPFCASRCGYCDFNTYTASELGGGASRDEYAGTVLRELELAARVIRPARVDTVFVGGGTPTLLSPADLGRILEGVDRTWGLAAGAEVTTEANPESVDPAGLRALRAAGFTRISLGMQSSAEHVLRVLDRRHTAGRAPAAAEEARRAGFEHVNLDLIYGTPGETPEDFDRSLRTVIDAGVDHVSAYALIVEDGTRMAGRMRRGELPYPSDDVAADRYLAAEQALTAAGFGWYEVSNWARPGGNCRHNELYWTGADWWGLGPGAHSHVGGVRWWNVKHPSAYAGRLQEGLSPGHGREVLTAEDRHVEDVMLRVRLREGITLAKVDAKAAKQALDDGLLDPEAYAAGRLVLTLNGRLLADAVIRDVIP